MYKYQINNIFNIVLDQLYLVFILFINLGRLMALMQAFNCIISGFNKLNYYDYVWNWNLLYLLYI